jgi:zinc and cadmium transporter
MATFYWILGATLLSSVGSLCLAALLLLFSQEQQKKIVPGLVSYAVGALLAGALVGLLPEAIHHFEAFDLGHKTPFLILLIAILVFFVLEKIIRVHHCHNTSCDSHSHETASMILIGDALHNFVDGVLIAASFSVSIEVGIIATTSIFVHEIAQEVGDFGILLHAGFSKRKAFLANLFSSLTALVGAILGYWFLAKMQIALPYIMMISVASFLYIALADLSPELHKTSTFKHSVKQLLLVLLGVGTILLVSIGHSH